MRIVNLARGGSLVTCSVIMLLNHHTYHCQRRSHVRRNFNGAAAAAKASEALHEFQEEALEDGQSLSCHVSNAFFPSFQLNSCIYIYI
jgi:hypothetical protein